MSVTIPKQDPKLHEHVWMYGDDLPVRFFRHVSNATGLYCQKHWHEQLELSYVVDGDFTVIIGGKNIRLQPGDVLFVNTNELHEYHINHAPIDIFCILLDISRLQGRFVSQYDSRYLLPMSTSSLRFQNHVKGDPAMHRFFSTLLREEDQREEGYEFAIISAVYGIIAHLVRHYTLDSLETGKRSGVPHNMKNINKAIAFIEKHYHEPISLDVLAEHLGFTKYYFCRLFKSMTGKSPVDYINEYRIHQAIRLLSDSDKSITDIALSVGFNDSNYFSRIFKAFAQLSPTAYRRYLAEQEAEHSETAKEE